MLIILGLVSVRRTDNGEYLYDLNIEGPQSSQDTTQSKLTGFPAIFFLLIFPGIVLDDKVNCIEKVNKWVIIGYHNARLCVYDVGIPKSHPIAECRTSKSGSVKSQRNFHKISH